MAEKVDDKKPLSDEGKIIIKAGAFRNMITHVLRFASESSDDPVEVMGVCMGTMDSSGETVVENAIPVAHGSRIEVGFSPEDYAAFAAIDEKFAEQGLYAVGWYHSHPGWGLFFSDTDVKNHLFYQKEQTPYSFGIVFDHTLMGKDGNMGFEIYRLDDYRENNSDYHRVQYEIEVPKTLDYFKWVQKFVEDSQKKAPILIKEINELTEPAPTESDLQEIPMTEAAEQQQKDPFPLITPVVKGFEEGTKAFSDSFMNTFKQQLGLWTNDINAGGVKGVEIIQKTTSQMKESVQIGLSKVKNWFEKNLEDIIEEFTTDVSKYIDDRVSQQNELKQSLPQLKEDILNGVNQKLDANIGALIESLNTKTDPLIENISKTANSNEKIKELLSANSELISGLANKSQQANDSVSKAIDGSLAPIEGDINGELDSLTSEVSGIKDDYAKMKEIFEKIQKVLMQLRNL